MQGLRDWCGALGWFRCPQSARDAADYDLEPAQTDPDGEKVQRLLELQDELHRLDRLPGILAGVRSDGTGEPLMGLTSLWRDRALEIEVEMEHLREEMSLEAMEREAVHRCASEAIGQRILQQIETRGRVAELLAARLPESWPEADAPLLHGAIAGAYGSE
jgi:hypothetical protein